MFYAIVAVVVAIALAWLLTRRPGRDDRVRYVVHYHTHRGKQANGYSTRREAVREARAMRRVYGTARVTNARGEEVDLDAPC
jgi:hypothetical protein